MSIHYIIKWVLVLYILDCDMKNEALSWMEVVIKF